MNKIRFDNKEQILFVKSNKSINLNGVLTTIEKIGNNEALPRRLSILEDARNADVTFDMKDLTKLIAKLKEILPKFEKIISAIVVNRPKITAYAILVGQGVRCEKYNLKVFSTPIAAKKWLKEQYQQS